MPATGSSCAAQTIEMRLHSDILFLAKQSHFVIWNYRDHLQFELPPEFHQRLFAIFQNPGEFNQSRETDRKLLRAGTLTNQREQEDEWGWGPLSKIHHFGTKNVSYDRPPKSAEEWATLYAEHSRKTIARIVTPSVHIDQELGIALPAPLSNLEHPQFIKNLDCRKTCGQFEDSTIDISVSSSALN